MAHSDPVPQFPWLVSRPGTARGSVSLRRMTIVNRRNAVVGFLVLKVGKVVARKKAKKLAQKLPSRRKP